MRTQGKLSSLVLSLSAIFAPHLQAQDFSLNVDVKLVNVFVNVTDKSGAIIGGLKKEDFALTEDGRPQSISVFERQSELPLNIALAIDTSGSVQIDMAREKSAAERFARTILRPQDKMALYEFATYVRELSGFTNKLSQIQRGFDSLRGGDATALYDAIYLASGRLAPLSGRRVLILVSDGGDTAKSTTYAQALEQALRGEVMIYSIIDVPIEASAGRDTGGEHALITLSEETGGKHFYVTEGGLDQAFTKVSEDLRTQYLLGYYPHKQLPGTNFHRIQVVIPRAADGSFNIRNRTGYYSDGITAKD
jgi:Ca-activated chloride channel homolog